MEDLRSTVTKLGMPEELALDAEENPLFEHGENQHTGRDNITSSPKQRGESSSYLARRIARDRPDILERMKRGAPIRAVAIRTA